MTASTIISFAALAFACVGCLILGLIFAYIAVFFRRLNKQLRRDRLSEYRLPPESMPQSRPCPKWMNRATGRAEAA